MIRFLNSLLMPRSIRFWILTSLASVSLCPVVGMQARAQAAGTETVDTHQANPGGDGAHFCGNPECHKHVTAGDVVQDPSTARRRAGALNGGGGPPSDGTGSPAESSAQVLPPKPQKARTKKILTVSN